MDWIYTTDELPDDDQEVWICKNNGEVIHATFYFDTVPHSTAFVTDYEILKPKNVKCWQPYFTPKPPK